MLDEKKLIKKLESEKMRQLYITARRNSNKTTLGYAAAGYVACINKAIKIVENLASEHNAGWIPCSERLPSKEEYQKCNGQFIVSDGNRTYTTYFDIYDTLKFGEPTITKFVIDRCVIAWQPLPEQYREERSE